MRMQRRSFFPAIWAALYGYAAPLLGAAPPQLFVRKFLMPSYPNVARKLFVQGEVSVRLHVRGNGVVESASALSGPQPLRDSVEWALKQWEFVVPDGRENDLVILFAFILDENETDACIFKVSGVLPSHFEIRLNYGPHMK
jgi:hypothetical protein